MLALRVGGSAFNSSTADRRKKEKVLRVGSTEEDLLVFRTDVWKADLRNNTTRLGCSSVAERLPRMCWALGLILHWKKERVKCPCRELMLFPMEFEQLPPSLQAHGDDPGGKIVLDTVFSFG